MCSSEEEDVDVGGSRQHLQSKLDDIVDLLSSQEKPGGDVGGTDERASLLAESKWNSLRSYVEKRRKSIDDPGLIRNRFSNSFRISEPDNNDSKIDYESATRHLRGSVEMTVMGQSASPDRRSQSQHSQHSEHCDRVNCFQWRRKKNYADFTLTDHALERLHNVALEAVSASRRAYRSIFEVTRVAELLTFGARYERSHTGLPTSSTAFVTFKTRVAKGSASQVLLSHKHFEMVVKSAPNPRDIIWDNITIPQHQIKMRDFISNLTLSVGAIFWSLVVGFITAISNMDSLAQQYTWLQKYQNTFLYALLNNYLAMGLLLALLALLPYIFDMIARTYEGLKLESEIQNSIMTRYFYYQLANVFVSIGLGAFAKSIHQIVEKPEAILSILGVSLPSFSIYFTGLIITKTFTSMPIEVSTESDSSAC
jgi:hypothetical protein